jgi:hypothetical protein
VLTFCRPLTCGVRRHWRTSVTTRDEIEQELQKVLEGGNALIQKLANQGELIPFATEYQLWYTRSLPIVKTLAPDRFDEFRRYYEADTKRKSVEVVTYTLQDYVNGLAPVATPSRPPFDHYQVALSRMLGQVQILASLKSRIDSVLANLEGHILADLEDRELRAAVSLAKESLRAAGAIAGVVLERHLTQVAKNRGAAVKKAHPTIGDFNEMLKKDGVYDMPVYRKIQYLSDVRNVCFHNKGREPTKEEVRELIDGVGAVIKTVF